jgi:hypothetical protein
LQLQDVGDEKVANGVKSLSSHLAVVANPRDLFVLCNAVVLKEALVRELLSTWLDKLDIPYFHASHWKQCKQSGKCGNTLQ